MIVDKAFIEKKFTEYVNDYDLSDIKIKLKADHTFRVADIAEKIADSIGADRELSWFTGILHDIGRFEQLTRYGTFKDADSIDHAELGADILFHDGLIDSFKDGIGSGLEIERLLHISEIAVRLHNKLAVPTDLDDETRLYTDILRDADKVDIFRVLTEPPYDDRNRRIRDTAVSHPFKASDDVMLCVREHRCVPRIYVKNDFEALISQSCMAFELNFRESKKAVNRQGFLAQLLNIELMDRDMRGQLENLKKELGSEGILL